MKYIIQQLSPELIIIMNDFKEILIIIEFLYSLKKYIHLDIKIRKGWI